MLPLILSAWYINRRSFFLFVIFLLLSLVKLVNAQHSGSIMAVAWFIVFFESILTITFTLQGLFQPVEEFVLSLPVSRSEIVRAKYLISVLGLITGFVLPLLTVWLAHLLYPVYAPDLSHEVFGIGGMAAIYLAIGIFLFLPFVYQFGADKGPTIFSISMVVLIMGCFVWKGIMTCSKFLMDFNANIMEGGTFVYLVGAGLLVLGFVSLSFSIWTYRKKVTIGGHPLSVSKIRTALHL